MDTCWGQPRFPVNSAVVEGKGITVSLTKQLMRKWSLLTKWDIPRYLAVLELEVCIRCDAIYMFLMQKGALAAQLVLLLGRENL